MKKIIRLIESERKTYMTNKEQYWKNKLIKILKDDGHGHHYPKYAKRLSDFNLSIISAIEEPEFTAAIDFAADEGRVGTIYVSDGFLIDDDTLLTTGVTVFEQLSMLIRHELSHNLLMHMIRMLHHLGEETNTHFQYSNSLQNLINIVTDFEISNKKYFGKDKNIARDLVLCGNVVHGLVTEDHRDWAKLSLEEMYDKMTQEIKDVQQKLLANRDDEIKLDDTINHDAISLYSMYRDKDSWCTLFASKDELLNSELFDSWPKVIQEMVKNIYDKVGLDSYTEQDIDEMKTQIVESSPTEILSLHSPTTGEIITKIYTPEEKKLAMDILKNIVAYKDAYTEWYTKVRSVLGGESADDLKKILGALL